ncbi:MAG TPA: TetR/AcrR family transcriptional regulator [Solirubrobacteraceae bacterium]
MDGTLTADISRRQIVQLQRTRIIDAMVAVSAEHGVGGASVARVIEHAGVSRVTFYELFEGVEDCFLAVVRSVMSRSTALILEAFEQEDRWLDGVRSALAALLSFLDAEPQLARVCVVETLAAGPRALEHRQRELAVLEPIIDAGRQQASATRQPPALAVEGVIASVIGVLHARLVSGQAPPFIELLGPLMGLVLLPYLDMKSLTAQIERAEAMSVAISRQRSSESLCEPPQSAMIPDELSDPVAYRARQCVLYVSGHPGASNRQIAAGIGVNHQGQISTLLGRLSRLGLLVKHPQGPGRANAWCLTARGERVAAALGSLLG